MEGRYEGKEGVFLKKKKKERRKGKRRFSRETVSLRLPLRARPWATRGARSASREQKNEEKGVPAMVALAWTKLFSTYWIEREVLPVETLPRTTSCANRKWNRGEKEA
jgi:hypothetical protein